MFISNRERPRNGFSESVAPAEEFEVFESGEPRNSQYSRWYRQLEETGDAYSQQ